MRYRTVDDYQRQVTWYAGELHAANKRNEALRDAVVELGAMVLRIDRNNYQATALARILTLAEVPAQELKAHNAERQRAIVAAKTRRHGRDQ